MVDLEQMIAMQKAEMLFLRPAARGSQQVTNVMKTLATQFLCDAMESAVGTSVTSAT